MPDWKPTTEDVARALMEQNPWQATGGQVPATLAPPTERPLVAGITNALLREDFRRFQVILGPRRVGKTTVMYQAARHLLAQGVAPQRLWWLRLDHPQFLDLDLGWLVTVIRTLAASPPSFDDPLFLFLDELVYAKDWDLWLKTFFDERWPVRIAGSSSAVGALHRRHPETGVGRWEERYLTPYLLTEYLALRGHPAEVGAVPSLSAAIEAVSEAPLDRRLLAEARRELLFTGGFPELLVRMIGGTEETERLVESQRVLRADAVERAIYKDIPQSFGVDNPMQLERLLYVAAGQATGLVSPTSISQQLGIASPTVEKYLTYLERSFVIFMLPNYSGSELSGQRRGRRLYFFDGAVRNAALERGLAPTQDPVEMGLLYENMAASHLYCLSLLTQVRCRHWRDRTDEVDLVYDDPADPLAFEVASSHRHPRRGLLRFVDRHPRFRGRAWLVAVDAPFVRAADAGDGIGQLSLDHFLVATGAAFHARLVSTLGSTIENR